MAGKSAERFGRPVAVGDAGLDRAVGVDHRGQDVGVALVQALLELLERGVDLALLPIDLGGAAPDHDHAVQALVLLEAGDVVAHLLGQVALALALLHVRAVELLHVLRVEHGGPGLDPFEERLHGRQVAVFEDARLLGRLVGAVGIDVPAPELEVFQAREGDEVLDEGRAVVGALAQANGAHLGEAADGLGEALAARFHSGHEGGGHRAHAGQQHAQLPRRRLDVASLARLRHEDVLPRCALSRRSKTPSLAGRLAGVICRERDARAAEAPRSMALLRRRGPGRRRRGTRGPPSAAPGRGEGPRNDAHPRGSGGCPSATSRSSVSNE